MTHVATDATPGPSPQHRNGVARAIAVDGSAAGKSTSVDACIQLSTVFDTGVMYRAVTWAALDANVDVDDVEALTALARNIEMDVSLAPPESSDRERVSVNGSDVTEALRTPEVEANVSLVSRVAGVREALVKTQRDIASQHEIVMAGRDIGTVVLPGADLKVYLDASLEERSRRRHQEFSGSGGGVTAEAVRDDIRRRDQIDTEREVSPLKPADDAIVIQTDGRTVDDVLRQVIELATHGR
jgi:cytidylate kinase